MSNKCKQECIILTFENFQQQDQEKINIQGFLGRLFSFTIKSSEKIWTNEEDQILTKAIDEIGTNWKKIASLIPNRNPSQCAQRWKRIKPESQKNRSVWTKEEDQQLLKLVSEHGRNWSTISEIMKGRSGKQIRERFINQLNPEIKREEWTKEEDEKILELFKLHGSKWTEISKQVPGRPNQQENMIKNRFYSFIRKEYMNIQNPYYIVPNQTDNKQQIQSDDEMPDERKSSKKNKKNKDLFRSLSCESLDKQEDGEKKIDQNEKQIPQKLTNLPSNLSELKRSFQPYKKSPPLQQSISQTSKDDKISSDQKLLIKNDDSQKPDDQMIRFGAYNQVITANNFSQSMESGKMNQESLSNSYENNFLLQRKQNGLKNPFAMSEEGSLKSSIDKYGSLQGNMTMEHMVMGQPQQYPFQFSSLFSANTVAIPIPMHPEMINLNIQMQQIQISEKITKANANSQLPQQFQQ